MISNETRFLVSEPYEQVFDFDTLEIAEAHIAERLANQSKSYPYEFVLYEARVLRRSDIPPGAK